MIIKRRMPENVMADINKQMMTELLGSRLLTGADVRSRKAQLLDVSVACRVCLWSATFTCNCSKCLHAAMLLLLRSYNEQPCRLLLLRQALAAGL
jgi:hypothetical protein